MVLCPCGFANSDGAARCAACGNPLFGAGAQAAGGVDDAALETTPSQVLELADLRGAVRVSIPSPGGAIGRAGDFCPEAFSPRVSGVHAILTCDDAGRWTIQHVGRNPSAVERAGSWVPLQTGVAHPLFGGELLKLADMVFRVSVGVPDADEGSQLGAIADDGRGAESGRVQPAPDPQSLVWSVRCPVCGTEHGVAGPDERVSACGFCSDAFDRKRIARVLPRRIASTQQPGGDVEPSRVAAADPARPSER